MTVYRRCCSKSTLNEHQMIDVQYEIQKLEADLEFHEQKIRLINHELEQKNAKLSDIMNKIAFFHNVQDRFTGEQNEN